MAKRNGICRCFRSYFNYIEKKKPLYGEYSAKLIVATVEKVKNGNVEKEKATAIKEHKVVRFKERSNGYFRKDFSEMIFFNHFCRCLSGLIPCKIKIVWKLNITNESFCILLFFFHISTAELVVVYTAVEIQ